LCIFHFERGNHEISNRIAQLFDARGASAAGRRWGDDGHKAVALIAQYYLTPTAKKQVDAMLAADTDPLTKHDIASAATWADRYRDSNHRKDLTTKPSAGTLSIWRSRTRI
jgi:hypothetical protein